MLVTTHTDLIHTELLLSVIIKLSKSEEKKMMWKSGIENKYNSYIGTTMGISADFLN